MSLIDKYFREWHEEVSISRLLQMLLVLFLVVCGLQFDGVNARRSN